MKEKDSKTELKLWWETERKMVYVIRETLGKKLVLDTGPLQFIYQES